MQQLVLAPLSNASPYHAPLLESLVKKLGSANIRAMKEDNETPDLPDLKDRLAWARERKKKTKADVANAVGISRAAYHDLESGNNHKTAYIVQIAEFLGVNPRWLALNKGSHFVTLVRQLPVENDNGTNYHQQSPKLNWPDIKRIMQTGTKLTRFEYEYFGDSMDGTKGPPVPSGSTLHIDPDAEQRPGRVVLAMLDDEPIVGVLSVNGTRRFARPTSAQFSAVDITDGRIIGVVVKITSPMP